MTNIHEEKKAIIQRFEQVNDADLIQAIKSLLDYGLRSDKTVFVGYRADGTLLTQTDLEKSIEAAEKDVEAGNYQTISDLRKESEGW